MGHIVNPISFRLGFNRTWNSAWSSFNFINYAYLMHRDIFLYNFFKLFFNNSLLIGNGFLYSHSKIIYLPNNQYNIVNYIYNQVLVNVKKKLYILLQSIYNILQKNNLSTQLKVDNNILVNLNTDRIYVIEVFLNKFYKYVYYYLFNVLYIKPVLVILKLLNVIIKKWLVMVSPQFNKFNISYIFLGFNQVTPHIITYYITEQLKRRNVLLKILKPIFKNLHNNIDVLGYKIACSGRFTRKQRATYFWVNNNFIPFNKLNAVIDYSYRQVALQFGVCGVKVWLCRRI